MTDPLIKFYDSVCVQKAVLWHNSEIIDDFGNRSYDSTEINVRWDGKRQMVRNEQGEEVVSEAEIMVTSDTPEIQSGDYIYLGKLNDLDSDQLTDPLKVEGSQRILAVPTTPLFKSSTKFIRTVNI